MGETRLLQMTGITKAFASNIVLSGVNLTVDAGETVAILGENGAGKSTLIKILGGIYKADSGIIQIEGKQMEIHSAAAAGAAGIRIIHQEIILVPGRTIAANVFLGRELKSRFGLVDIKRMEWETQKVIDSLGLKLRADQLVGSLSMGMQQLVEIIKAVSANARIVVMDEPTSSLSQGETRTLFGIIRLLKEKRVGIIYISHRLEELAEVTDRIEVLRDGRMVGSAETKSADQDQLIRMMVGRELSSYYTKSSHAVGETALEVKALSHIKYFKNLNFYVRYGEIVGFAGLVGAGRTEAMKTIFGAYQKSGGEIFLDGKPAGIRSPKDAIDKGIVYVSEDRRGEGLILNQDVQFNMGLACLKDFVGGLRVRHEAWEAMVESCRKKFSIKLTSPRQPAADLSGGNQQKVVLGKWLAVNPRVIMLDEPTRGIDVGAKAEIYAIIDDLAAKGAAVILVSSELTEIINMCSRCYVMCEGRMTGELGEAEFTQERMMNYATGVKCR